MHTCLILIVAFTSLVQGDTCVKPEVSKSFYTTTERQLADQTAFIVKFNLACSNDVQDVSLYADISGKQFPITKSPEENTYQLSWVAENSKAPAGTYSVRIFDEDGLNAVKKALRNEEDTSQIKSLLTVDVQHPGVSRVFWLTSESLGLLFAVLTYYAVCKLRSEIIN